MKSKILIFTAILLTIALATCIFAAGDFNSNKQTSSDTVTAGVFSINEKASGKAVYTYPDGTKTDLTYSKSAKDDTNQLLDFYMDSEGDSYLFDKNGHLRSFIADTKKFNLEPNGNTSSFKVISESEAAKVSIDHARHLFGNIVDEFEFDSITLSSCGNIYYVEHTIPLGENGFIKGPTIRSHIGKNGFILTTVLQRYFDTVSFTSSKSINISEADILQFAEKQALAEFGDSFNSTDVKMVSLVNDNGSYKLRVKVYVNITLEDGEITEQNCTYYYNL